MEELQSFLDRGTSFEGRIAFSGRVRIDGDFKGEASADGTLVIGETSTVEATLELESLIVNGTFRGSVLARERVEVGPEGVVEGKVQTAALAVADGARVDASIEMTRPTPERGSEDRAGR